MCDCWGLLTKESPTEKALQILIMLAHHWGREKMSNSFYSPFTTLNICQAAPLVTLNSRQVRLSGLYWKSALDSSETPPNTKSGNEKDRTQDSMRVPRSSYIKVIKGNTENVLTKNMEQSSQREFCSWNKTPFLSSFLFGCWYFFFPFTYYCKEENGKSGRGLDWRKTEGSLPLWGRDFNF